MSVLINRLFFVGTQISNCDRKVHFSTKGQAMRHADKFEHELYPYRCLICDEWHLTSDPGPTRRKS